MIDRAIIMPSLVSLGIRSEIASSVVKDDDA
jgi:hypothetical protein